MGIFRQIAHLFCCTCFQAAVIIARQPENRIKAKGSLKTASCVWVTLNFISGCLFLAHYLFSGCLTTKRRGWVFIAKSCLRFAGLIFQAAVIIARQDSLKTAYCVWVALNFISGCLFPAHYPFSGCLNAKRRGLLFIAKSRLCCAVLIFQPAPKSSQ